MIEWLKKIRAPKFYRYWFYRQYLLSKSLGDDDAEFSSTIGSSISIALHFFFLVFLIGNGVFGLDISNSMFSTVNYGAIILYYIIFLSISYLLFFYNKKYTIVIKEFEGETKNTRKKGLFYLLIYFLITFFGLLAICVNFFITPRG